MPLALIATIFAFCANHPAAKQGKPEPAWMEQTFAEGVRISAPGLLRPKKVNLPEPPPETIGYGFWEFKNEECYYVVSVVRYSATQSIDRRASLAGFAHGITKTSGTVIDGVRDLLVQGWPGLAITVVRNGEVQVARSYAFESSLVSITCAYPAVEPRPTVIDRFQNSIKFLSDGPVKKIGPELNPFVLGDSGLTAIFPHKPKMMSDEIGIGVNKGTFYMFAADDALRRYVVAYRDAPALPDNPSDAIISDIYDSFQRSMLDAFDAKKTKTRDFAVGKDTGVLTEFTAGKGMAGKVLVYMHGKRVILLLVLNPKVYEDPDTINSFLRSVEYKS